MAQDFNGFPDPPISRSRGTIPGSRFLPSARSGECGGHSRHHDHNYGLHAFRQTSGKTNIQFSCLLAVTGLCLLVLLNCNKKPPEMRWDDFQMRQGCVNTLDGLLITHHLHKAELPPLSGRNIETLLSLASKEVGWKPLGENLPPPDGPEPQPIHVLGEYLIVGPDLIGYRVVWTSDHDTSHRYGVTESRRILSTQQASLNTSWQSEKPKYGQTMSSPNQGGAAEATPQPPDLLIPIPTNPSATE